MYTNLKKIFFFLKSCVIHELYKRQFRDCEWGHTYNTSLVSVNITNNLSFALVVTMKLPEPFNIFTYCMFYTHIHAHRLFLIEKEIRFHSYDKTITGELWLLTWLWYNFLGTWPSVRHCRAKWAEVIGHPTCCHCFFLLNFQAPWALAFLCSPWRNHIKFFWEFYYNFPSFVLQTLDSCYFSHLPIQTRDHLQQTSLWAHTASIWVHLF